MSTSTKALFSMVTTAGTAGKWTCVKQCALALKASLCSQVFPFHSHFSGQTKSYTPLRRVSLVQEEGGQDTYLSMSLMMLLEFSCW